jgi:hypothetical protein
MVRGLHCLAHEENHHARLRHRPGGYADGPTCLGAPQTEPSGFSADPFCGPDREISVRREPRSAAEPWHPGARQSLPAIACSVSRFANDIELRDRCNRAAMARTGTPCEPPARSRPNWEARPRVKPPPDPRFSSRGNIGKHTSARALAVAALQTRVRQSRHMNSTILVQRSLIRQRGAPGCSELTTCVPVRPWKSKSQQRKH